MKKYIGLLAAETEGIMDPQPRRRWQSILAAHRAGNGHGRPGSSAGCSRRGAWRAGSCRV